MSHISNDLDQQQAYEQGQASGYEDCMKEWLGFLRVEIKRLEDIKVTVNPHSDMYAACYLRIEGIKHLIRERWSIEADVASD